MSHVQIAVIWAMVMISLPVSGQWIAVDKQKHAVAGAVIGGMAASDKKAKHPIWNAVIFSTVVGVGKEFMDLGGGTVDAYDALATVAGGVVGGVVVYSIRKKIERIKIKRTYGINKKRKRQKRRT